MEKQTENVSSFVIGLTRLIRNINLDDPIQLAVFRKVAESKITKFLDDQLNEKIDQLNLDKDKFAMGYLKFCINGSAPEAGRSSVRSLSDYKKSLNIE